MLKTVASLWLQSILYLIGHLDQYSPKVLALLPIKIRKWLLLNLPVADICRYELGEFTCDIDMEEIWRLHSTRMWMQAGLVQLENREEGFWKRRYLEQLWEFGMIEPSGYWLQSYLHNAGVQNPAKNKVLCQWHNTNKGLFALNTGNENEELDLGNIYWHYRHQDDMTEFATNLSRITTFHCNKCIATFHIPNRYVKYAIKEYNLVSLITLFYSFCNFKPQTITLSHPNMCKMVAPLSQTILNRHPDILNNVLNKTQFLRLLPLFFSDISSIQKQMHCYNIVMNSLYTSTRSSLQELDKHLMVSPFEALTLQEPFRQLKFLSISSLHHNILEKLSINRLVAFHHSTLRVIDIKQCSFRSMLNLSTLTNLFTSQQFSTMTFHRSVFVVNTFQELLFNFVTSTVQGEQILSFKNALLEGNESFRLPVKKEYPCPSLMTKTLDVEDMRAAFYSLRELQRSLKQFPTLYLNRLNLKEMPSLEIVSFLPLIKAQEFCLSISNISCLSNNSVDILKTFLATNKFQSVSFCINIDNESSTNRDLIQQFGKCITAPVTLLKSVKITWMIEQYPNVPTHQRQNTNELIFEDLLASIMTCNRLDKLELDISESYYNKSSSLNIVYRAWNKNSKGMQLARLVISREANADISMCMTMATDVIETSTTCEI